MIKTLFSLTLILVSTGLFGQNDSLKNEILDYSNTKTELISKGRTLLLDKFLEGDYSKVKEIKNYLINDVENNDYLALYPAEYWMILYWTQEYKELLNSIQNLDSAKIISYQTRIRPQNDLLYKKILDKSRESRLQLEASIKNADIKNVDKDFLEMHLQYLLFDKDHPEINQDTLNNLADNFLTKYPDSKYADFTRRFVRYKLIPSKWGFAFEFFSGYGFFTGNLKNIFNNNVPMGVAFDVSYKKLILYLRDYIGFSKTKVDMIYSKGVWEKGSNATIFLPEASLGYTAMDNKRIKLAPFVGIASTGIGPSEYDQQQNPDLKNADLGFTATYTLGLNFDIKLKRSKAKMVTNGPEQSYWFLRLRYAYNLSQFENKYPGFDGNMHYLTIGIGGFGRAIKRQL